MKKLNSNHLKLIAIIAMTIDHIADLIYPRMPNNIISNILHIIGRLTAPIMFFFICEGFYYTKNLKKYILRLFIFNSSYIRKKQKETEGKILKIETDYALKEKHLQEKYTEIGKNRRGKHNAKDRRKRVFSDPIFQSVR